MQFREQGNKIQCIRSTYDPASKRSNQKVVAVFDRWADSLSSAVATDLTAREQSGLSLWFYSRQSAKAERMHQSRVTSAASTLMQLSKSIDITGGAMTDSEAALAWDALAGVAKALRKAGHPKPQRERPARVVPAGQADLLAEAVEPAPAALPPSSTCV